MTRHYTAARWPYQPLGRALGCIAGIACAVLAQPASAITGSVTVYWDTLTIELTNADPLDSIAPQLTWLTQATYSGSFRDGIGPLPDFRFAQDWVTPQSTSYRDATLFATTESGTERLHVHAASGGGAPSGTRIDRDGILQVDRAAHVRASVSMEAHVSATPAELLWRGGVYGTVWPYADANLFFADGTGTAMTNVAYLRADLDAWGTDTVGVLTATVTLGAGDTAHLRSQPGVILNPVPEPATWITLLAGLGLLGHHRLVRQGRRSLSASGESA